MLAWSSYDKWCGKQCIGRFLSPVQCWNVTAHLSTVLKGNFDIQYLYFSSVFPFSARLQKLWENNLNTEQSLWGLQHWTTWWRCLLHDLPTRVESHRLQTPPNLWENAVCLNHEQIKLYSVDDLNNSNASEGQERRKDKCSKLIKGPEYSDR